MTKNFPSKVYKIILPVLEQPDGEHGESEEEGVEQQQQAVELVHQGLQYKSPCQSYKCFGSDL